MLFYYYSLTYIDNSMTEVRNKNEN